jgi:hypothetical protein
LAGGDSDWQGLGNLRPHLWVFIRIVLFFHPGLQDNVSLAFAQESFKILPVVASLGHSTTSWHKNEQLKPFWVKLQGKINPGVSQLAMAEHE